MALIKCSECNKDVSDKAASCPNCGAPVNIEEIKRLERTKAIEGYMRSPKGQKLGKAAIVFTVCAYALILYDCSQTSRQETKINQESSEAKPFSHSRYITSEEAFEICKAAFLAISKDPEKAVIPFVNDQGGYAESRFTWGAGTRMLRMRNGLGLEVAATGYCGIDRETKEIIDLHLNGEEIINRPPVTFNVSKIKLNEPFEIPNDPGATYKILSIKRKGDIAEISSERRSQMYLGYTRREFDCENNMIRYIAEGGTKQDLEKRNPGEWGLIVDGSIAYWQGKIACNKSGK